MTTDGGDPAAIPGGGLRRILAPNPSAMTGPGTNSYLLGTGRAVAVIDPGPDLDAHLHAVLAAIGPHQAVSHILVTHPHLDHSGLARKLAALTGAPILGFGPAGSGRTLRMQQLAAAGDPGGGEGSDAHFFPDRRLAHGDIVTGDGWQLEVLHSPGHMAEHLCFACGETLFSGDHVMGWSTSLVSPPDGDMGAYMASLDLLRRRAWARFLPGHGAAIDDPAARLTMLVAHRRAREGAILAALAAGAHSLADIAARVYADTPRDLHPAATRNAFAHIVDLADKDLVIATPALTPQARFHLA